ncbi:hypothetical protein CBS101457_004787 [Exobasidium rhododendri]|nr:hypothetical protein CBS101457_004787 [Exobasidium rhododendri]
MDSQLVGGYGFAQADEAGLKKHEFLPPHVGTDHHTNEEIHEEKKGGSKSSTEIVEHLREGRGNVDEDDAFDYNVSEHDRINLRRVPAPIPWTAFLVAVCELAERFSYYGTTQVFTNFIQQPLPAGSTTGSNPSADGTAGALGKGQQASTGITTFNTFWVYTCPLIGGYLADTKLGRFNTVCLGVGIALVGHVLFIISALPPVLKGADAALAPFVLGVIINGVGTGFFKSTVSPLIAEQIKAERQYIQVLPKSGERVIVDPTVTAARLFDFFYLMINIGAIGGQVAMPFAEKYVGYWLAYLLPTIVFLICVPILFFARNRYVKTPPSGSVLSNALKLLRMASKGRFSWNPVRWFKNMTAPDFWENVKPSHLGANKPHWMTFDDKWVEEVRRGYKACYVFLLFPFYWLCYNQISGNLVSQGATMTLNGVPNEIPQNLDPLSIIFFVPVFEYGLYPALRRMGFKFTALKKIFTGFMFASAGMVWAAVLQYYIYQTSNCGYQASAETDAAGNACISPLSVWIQIGPYALIGISELFASVISLEYALTKAPRNMRSLVMAVGLFTTAIGSAIQEAFIPLVKDPLLVWMYTSFACIAFVAGCLFAVMYRGIDAEEDYLNNLQTSQYKSHKDADAEAWDMEQNNRSHEKTVSTPEKEQ